MKCSNCYVLKKDAEVSLIMIEFKRNFFSAINFIDRVRLDKWVFSFGRGLTSL